jgi:hypothetical protein
MLFWLAIEALEEALEGGGRPLRRLATPALNFFPDSPSRGCMSGEIFSGSAIETTTPPLAMSFRIILVPDWKDQRDRRLFRINYVENYYS